MATDHVRVVVPTLEVMNCDTFLCSKSECRSAIIDLVLFCDRELFVLHVLLTLNDTDNHASHYVKGRLGMMVRAPDRFIHQIVSSKEKLRDVTTQVVNQIELSTWMDSLVSIQVEN